MDLLVWVWLGAIVLFIVVEAATTALVSVWFVAGAVAALIAAVVHAPLAVQLVMFVVISALALVVSRPLARRLMSRPPVPTNLDRVIGETARVTEAVDNGRASGAVYVDGKTWTARSADGETLPVGTEVTVQRMEGVKLFVKKIEENVEVVS